MEFWRELGDPLLNELVVRALKDSPDVVRATAKIRESRALAGAAWASLFPDLQGGFGYERIRLSTQTPFLSQVPLQTFPGFVAEQNDWKASLTASYELDFWGKARRTHESALRELEGDVERRRSVGLSLAGDVSTTYIEYRTLEGRRRITVQELEELKALRTISRDRFQGGLGSDLDVARADTEIARTEASLADYARLLAITEHRLAVLAASPPGSLRKDLESSPGNLKGFAVPPGLPIQLLERRPDLRELSRRVQAATARIGAVKADLLPRLVLAGEIGSEAVDLSKLTSHGAYYWSAGPSLQIPLFDFGRRRDNWTAAEERAEQLLRDLEKQILIALQEVEDALSSVREDGRRREALAAAVQASRRGAKIAFDKFQGGLVSQLEVIDAERTRLEAEDALIEAEGRVQKNAVSLAKALGGGFGAAERHMRPMDPEAKE
jgi:NodT family efflux transporter outer membrane factor (OMF) lipoprotein